MSIEYIDPQMPKRIESWASPALGLEMPIVSYGHAGKPILLFPTAAADFLENERFFLIRSIEPAILAGRIRVFSIESINRYAWMDRSLPVVEQARRQGLYSRYIEEEVVPFIRHACGDGGIRIATAGASFGAFHAANALFRRPDLFDTLIGMSGFYDLDGDYLKGYSDENCYFNNPSWYVAHMSGEILNILQHHCRVHLVSGQGAWESPDATRRFALLLERKGIRHEIDLWGHDVNHDWPWWRKMLPYYAERLGW